MFYVIALCMVMWVTIMWALNVNAWIWSVFMYTKDERAGVLYS